MKDELGRAVNKFGIGENVFIVDFDIYRTEIVNIDSINDTNKYWLKGMFGYFHEYMLFKTKNEAIDYLIKSLEDKKDV